MAIAAILIVEDGGELLYLQNDLAEMLMIAQ